MMRLPMVANIEGTPFGKTIANNMVVKSSFDQLASSIQDTLESSLLELVRLRVASNNGCEY